MLIHQIAYIDMILFTQHVIHRSNNTQQGHNLGPIQQGTSRSLHKQEPVWFHASIHHFITKQATQNGPILGPIYYRAPLGPFTVRHRIIGIPKHTTKPEDISPRIKTKPQHSPELPENSSENLVRTVRKFNSNCSKTIPKFSPDCLKTVSKILKNSYTQSKKFGTEIYRLSRPLRKFQAIK